MDARSCIRHGSWKAGCITKGACPVWKAGIGNRRQQCRTALVLDLTKADGTREMELRSVMLMPSLVCLLGAVDAINRASLQFRETGEGVVGIREQEAVGGRVADNGDRPVANAPFNPIA